MSWQIYLSGEIHTDWRERIERGAAAAGLDLRFTAPVTDHAASDAAGTAIFGEQERPFWNDHLGAGVNAHRQRPPLVVEQIAAPGPIAENAPPRCLIVGIEAKQRRQLPTIPSRVGVGTAGTPRSSTATPGCRTRTWSAMRHKP